MVGVLGITAFSQGRPITVVRQAAKPKGPVITSRIIDRKSNEVGGVLNFANVPIAECPHQGLDIWYRDRTGRVKDLALSKFLSLTETRKQQTTAIKRTVSWGISDSGLFGLRDAQNNWQAITCLKSLEAVTAGLKHAYGYRVPQNINLALENARKALVPITPASSTPNTAPATIPTVGRSRPTPITGPVNLFSNRLGS